MKAPWANTTGLSKAVVILCTIFLVALGLCGANFVTVMLCCDDFITETPNYVPKLATRILSLTGMAEVAVMAICLAALLILAIISVAIAVARLLRNGK